MTAIRRVRPESPEPQLLACTLDVMRPTMRPPTASRSVLTILVIIACTASLAGCGFATPTHVLSTREAGRWVSNNLVGTFTRTDDGVHDTTSDGLDRVTYTFEDQDGRSSTVTSSIVYPGPFRVLTSVYNTTDYAYVYQVSRQAEILDALHGYDASVNSSDRLFSVTVEFPCDYAALEKVSHDVGAALDVSPAPIKGDISLDPGEIRIGCSENTDQGGTYLTDVDFPKEGDHADADTLLTKLKRTYVDYSRRGYIANKPPDSVLATVRPRTLTMTLDGQPLCPACWFDWASQLQSLDDQTGPYTDQTGFFTNAFDVTANKHDGRTSQSQDEFARLVETLGGTYTDLGLTGTEQAGATWARDGHTWVATKSDATSCVNDSGETVAVSHVQVSVTRDGQPLDLFDPASRCLLMGDNNRPVYSIAGLESMLDITITVDYLTTQAIINP